MPESHAQRTRQQDAAKREAAIIRALAEAPKLTPEQTSAIVGLLLVNTEAPEAGWEDNTAAGGGAA